MDWWLAGVALGGVVLVTGLFFLAKRWAGEGEGKVKYKALEVAGSPAFVVTVLGFAWAAFSIVQLAQGQDERRDPSIVVGKVREVRNVPSFRFAEEAPEDEGMHAYGSWLLKFFEDGQIVINKGKDDGLREGQHVTTLDESVTPRRVRRSELGAYNSAGTATLKLVNVYGNESVAQLEAFAIESYLRRIDKVDAGEPVPGPAVKGQRVLALPENESEAAAEVARALQEAEKQGLSRDARRIYYRDAVSRAQRFLRTHASSFFAPDVLFQLGDAQRALGRRVDAVQTFEEFLDRYPFHASADGARERLEKLTGSAAALE